MVLFSKVPLDRLSDHQKHRWFFMQIWQSTLFPFAYSFSHYHFIWQADMAGNTQTGISGTANQNRIQHMLVAVGRFDKNLCLVMGL